jgi:hypothetical protein
MSDNRILAALGLALTACSTSAAPVEIILTYPTQTSGPCRFTVTAPDGISLDPATGNLTTQGTFGDGCPTCIGTGCSDHVPVIVQGLQSTPFVPVFNQPFTVSWVITNATECTTDGSAFPTGSLAGWPTSGQICSTASTCGASSIFVNGLSAPGGYHFALNCTNGGFNPVSSQLDLFFKGGGSSGITRQVVGTVINGGTTRTNVDMTSYPEVFGYDPSDGTTGHPFPGIDAGPVGLNLTKNKYFSLKFTVPGVIEPGTVGRWSFNGSAFTAPVSLNISGQEGNFNLGIPTECGKSGGGTESTALFWSINGSLPGTCALTPGQTYYLNFVNAALASPAMSTCPTASCSFQVTNTVFVQ